MSSKKQKLLVIDGNALVHRAFHALPPTMTDAQGRPTNAVYGFTTIFLKAIKDLKPDYVAACFDMKAKTFRHEQFDGYKATRTKAPDELYGQIPLVKEVLGVFGVPVFELSGFEADDLIGTICTLKSVDRPDIDSIILTGDQDCLQLVDYNTFVLTPHKGLSETMLYGEEEVKFKFGGLLPKQLIDYKGIRGDVSDNIPGVRGIGEKGAIELLNNFGSLENVYKNIDSAKIKDRTRELLKIHEKEALMSKELATIIRDAKIDFVLKDCRLDGIDQTAILDLFQELGFKRLMSQVATMAKSGLIKVGGQNSLFDLVAEKVTGKRHEEAPVKIEHKNIGKQDYQLITEENIGDFLKELKGQDQFCFDTETDRLSGVASNLVGISFCYAAGTAYYLPVAEADGIKKELIKIFTDSKIKKIGHNLKYDIEVMRRYLGEDVEGIYFDTMVASYLLNAGHRQHSLDTLAFVEFGYQMQPIEELIGTGKDQISMKDVAVEKASWYAGEDADLTYRLFEKYLPEIEKANLGVIFNDLEIPLIKVLAEIERNGVKINSEQLGKQSEEFGKEIKKIEKKAYKLAGEEFNLSSPKQLKEILFEKMDIDGSGLAKTKTGISTGASELEKLARWLRENNESQDKVQMIDLIIRHREISKLKSTYLDALPKLVNPETGRVHTSFNQTVTATGRLSSSDPNLQNIPIRTDEGRLIRQAFIAEDGFKLVKADYSQIELRVIASLANDKQMLAIFNSGGDIHTMTAALIHGIKPEEVTKELRRQAKEINFGVLYGMGAWGLSSRTGLSHSEAQKFIFRYFETFSEVKKWLDETVEIAKDKGYVETLYGRRRYLPEINSSIQQVKSTAERMATNMPIQGTAADLIKLAMIEIGSGLAKVSKDSRMILQVHDELVFEVPEYDVKKVAEYIDKTMCSVMKLRAPIEVEVSIGDNWGETEKI